MKCKYFIGSRVRYCGNWSFRLLTTSGPSPAPLVISMTPPDQRNGIIALSFFILPSSFENLSQFLLFCSLSKLYQLSSVISQFSQLTGAGSVEKIRNCSKFDCCFESGYSSITHIGLLKFLTNQLSVDLHLHYTYTCGLSKRTVKNFASNGGCATFFGPFSTCSYFVSQFWHHVVVCGWLKCHNVRGRCLRRRIIRQPCL